MNAFTIKDLENLTGIKAHTIRIWEQRYHFLKPERTDTNIRYYNNEELKKILNISLLNKFGYKISHIDKMDDEEINNKILQLSQLQALQERIIHDLIQSMISLDLDLFEETLNKHIEVKGIEKTIHQIIFPFMERIGVLWLAGHINPAQEHLVSNIVRQKILVGTESLSPVIHQPKTALLFLPEGEFHELGLLYMQYFLKNRGFRVIYLGANIPAVDIEYVVKMKTPDFLYTHITAASNGFSFDRFITQAVKKFGEIPMIISGRLASTYEKRLPDKITFKKSLSEVTDHISQLLK
ncbi:MerR family transcriptional regulator [Pollutibacter soli]|uniref:MerR family transcriptional regulator n=1 Tax=Pollutibacter soli TaxID=3034157 RepID=UPI0030135095